MIYVHKGYGRKKNTTRNIIPQNVRRAIAQNVGPFTAAGPQ
jgi:hypothetical protein